LLPTSVVAFSLVLDEEHYDLFGKMKEPLQGTRYNTIEEIIHAVGHC
jgi:hypothetical protein